MWSERQTKGGKKGPNDKERNETMQNDDERFHLSRHEWKRRKTRNRRNPFADFAAMQHETGRLVAMESKDAHKRQDM